MIKTEKRDIFALHEYANNANDHPDEQVEQIAASILEFGFNDPLSIDETDTILTGHGTHKALKLLVSRGREEFREIDCVVLSHMSDRQKRAYVLTHNKLARNSVWNFDKLSQELSDLVELDFSVDLIGFDEQELDGLLKTDSSILPDENAAPAAPTSETEEEDKPKRTRAKSKILHTCPACKHEFTA
jgi:ParB-like chromosome segregation protein Spo0J